MAKVLVLTLVFPPDGVSTARIVGDIASDLARSGHEVVVVTTKPHYNRDQQAELAQPRTQLWGALLSASQFSGTVVYHTFMPKKGRSVVARLAAWSGFHLLSALVCLAKVRSVNVIVAPSPPLTIGVCAWLLGWWYRAPVVYNVQELYPDIAISLGAVSNPHLIRALLGLERFVYARAAVVTTIAPRMRQRIIEKGVPRDKVHLIPNFVDVEQMCPMPKRNAFAMAHGLDTSFVVSYAGNIGPAQGLDALIDAAALLRDRRDVVFALIGGGGARDELMRRVAELRLDNVKFIEYQPYDLVPQIYGASDLCVVALAAGTGSEAIPSKVYRIMAAERAVLAVTDEASDLAQLVRSAECGLIAGPGQAGEVAAAVQTALSRPALLRAMARSGRHHVLAHYSREAVTKKYDAVIRSLATAEAPPVLRA